MRDAIDANRWCLTDNAGTVLTTFGSGCPVYDAERCLVLVIRFDTGSIAWCGQFDDSVCTGTVSLVDLATAPVVPLRLLGEGSGPTFGAKLHELVVRSTPQSDANIFSLCASLKAKWDIIRPVDVDWDAMAWYSLRTPADVGITTLGQSVQRWQPKDATFGALLAMSMTTPVTLPVLAKNPLDGVVPHDSQTVGIFAIDQLLFSADRLINTTWALVFSTQWLDADIPQARSRRHGLRERATRAPSSSVSETTTRTT